MPRGKNYVNNNRGVSLQASKKKKSPSMEQCFYGKGCTRADCFYRHDGPDAGGGGDKSGEPCMPFLAGLCTFTASGCRKRHPGKAEAERLIAKYKSTKCRYGDHCKTTGCLYIHPSDNDDNNKNGKGLVTAAFPPLNNGGGGVRCTVATPLAGAWKPMQPTGGATGTATTPRQQQQPPVKSAWVPSPPPAPAPAWGGQGRNPVLVNHANNNNNNTNTTSPQGLKNGATPKSTTYNKPATLQNGSNGNAGSNGMVVSPNNNTQATPKPSTPPTTTTTTTPVAVNNTKSQSPATSSNNNNPVVTPPPPPPTPRTSALNIHAKVFVPGGGF